MIKHYDILERLSQREDGTMPPENEVMVQVANDIRRITLSSGICEAEAQCSLGDVTDQEKRAAEQWSKQHSCWMPIDNIFSLGSPGPSGSESDTYISKEGYVYKTNNLMHCLDSIVASLNRYVMHNIIFSDSAYTFVGFTGFDGRSVYPIVRQYLIKDGNHATQNEIDCYMSAIGFDKDGTGKFHNDEFFVSDLLPKNVLRDSTGDIFVIDAEISMIM